MDQILRFGATWPVPNSSALPASIDCSQASVRYVIDEEVAAICDRLVTHHFDMLVDMLSLARVPSSSFWLERVSFAENGEGGRSRLGCSVLASESGRAGEIVLVAEVPDSVPVVLPQKVVFNFDGHLIQQDGDALFRLPIAPTADTEQKIVSEVFAIELHPGWEKYYRFAQQESQLVGQMKAELSASVYDGLFILAFSVLLSSERSFREINVQLDRLNRHRVMAGRHKLLDHIEVKSSLFGASQGKVHGGGKDDGERSFPRLHVVRGHFVRKGARLYWRRTHMRGSATSGAVTRTVNISV